LERKRIIMRQILRVPYVNPVSLTPLSSRLAPFSDRRTSWFLVCLLIGFCWLKTNPDLAFASGVVTNCDQASLEAALAGGGNLSFACSGVIVLTNTLRITTDTVLDGTGQSITISGNDRVRLFTVGSNVSFTIFNLALAHGNDDGAPGDAQTPGGTGYGGAVFVEGGVLHANNCRFIENRATGGSGTNFYDAGSAYGGSVFIDLGALHANNCQFIENRATGGFGIDFSYAGGAYGGAIYNRSGSLDLTNCTFSSNLTAGGRVQAALSQRAGAGIGGAIYNDNGVLRAFGTRFFANVAQGGVSVAFARGADGAAFGGAVYSTNGTVEFRNCILSTNKTIVGPVLRTTVPAPAGGGAVYADQGLLTLVASVFSDNQCRGDGGWGATEGNGGAVFNSGELSVSKCSFLRNSAVGGTGIAGTGGSKAGNGGAIYNLSLAAIVGTTFNGNSAVGGAGIGYENGSSNGGDGNGGAIYSKAQVSLVNCTLFENAALGGDGENNRPYLPTEGGPGHGGAVFVSSGSFAATNLTFAMNSAQGGKGGTGYLVGPGGLTYRKSDGTGSGSAFYVATGATATAINTILANSLSGSNCFGTLIDAGHNISSDASGNFTSPGSLNSTDARLGLFGDYGGPTATMPLLSGSPAIDAGDSTACPAVDQRGISRPYGAGCDIGAFESAPPFTVNGHIRGYLSPQGVVVNVASNSVPVDASEFYTFTGLSPGTHLVTPTATETRFVPGRRVVQVGPDDIGIDFNAYRLNALEVETSTNRGYQIVFAPAIEGTYHTEVSTNLVDWSLYSTNTADTNGVFVITNFYFGSGNATFFRVVKP
jgi:hypothetical protein